VRETDCPANNTTQTSSEAVTLKTAETTTFVEDASVRATERAVPVEKTKALAADANTGQTIADFLRRPIVVATGTWAVDGLIANNLTSFDIGTKL
jgi:hypothetical protein